MMRWLTEMGLGRSRSTTIVVAKGICSPSRNAITSSLKRVGIVIHGIEEWAIDAQGNQMPIGPSSWSKAVAYCASVRVSNQAARWAEYNLLRSGKFQLVSKPIDQRNIAWAAKWKGVPPKTWVESGCDPKPPPSPHNKRSGRR